MELPMKRSSALTSLLRAAGLIHTTAQSAENVCADQVTGFNEIGVFSLHGLSGSPQEIERIVALTADRQGASFYRIIQLEENSSANAWSVQAIFYA
ncbi:hypothetical protein EBL_c35650 [Shimwellia blattae DSM 4481 = NBRC 105725]|uniref:YdgH/BhsA/McbA-like domain-containing protein n=2 Tax=Shimwellia blattae TaxID=563 RepID=I2BDL6_SHIBC|nr:hypothetical protein EBL_c35650 [Shimwellia blattae DSM 4481 = NBRC 105725]